MVQENVVRLALRAMRTRWELVLPVPRGEDAANLRAAGEEAFLEIERAEQMLSAFRPGSDLFRLNHEAQSGAPVRVPGPLFAFLMRVQTLALQTDGAFDPAIGPIVDLWEGTSQNGCIPTEAEIVDARQNVNMAQSIILDEAAQTVTYLRPGVRLNMGAVGKGWAADEAMDSLRENGVTSALLHGGTSTVYGLGTPHGDENGGWKVAVQNPILPPGSKPLGVVCLQNAALGVSAVHGKIYGADQGRTFGHVLDARTGWPIQNTLLAAVVSDAATNADALSTALLVAGERGFSRLAERFPDAGFFVVEKEANQRGAGLRMEKTPHFFHSPSR